MRIGDLIFREVWCVDFEFSAPAGEPPLVVCLVAHEICSGKKLRLWQDDIQKLDSPPYAIDKNALFVAYYASAEMGCHLVLDWPLPINVLDLFSEFRNTTNGLRLPCGAGLLGAQAWYGINSIESAEKESMRLLAQRNGAWSETEIQALLNYCASDVKALSTLLQKMAPDLDISRALLRGRYMKAAAQIEHNGIPINSQFLFHLREQWEAIQDHLVSRIDQNYGVYEGRTFKTARFANYLVTNDLPWPKLDSGSLDLKDETFREMAISYPKIAPLRELRATLSRMRLSELTIGKDGRNRCLLSAFRARTGRNQPSNSKFIFGAAVWLRSLIRAKPDHGIAYIDWSQQEFGIAAALSDDPLMKEAYVSGDPYLAFAKQAGAVPKDATKQTHKSERDQFKACVLAVQYGMGAESLAQRIGQTATHARRLLELHRHTYRTFWAWSDSVVDHAMLHGRIWTVFGWTIHTATNPNPRFLRNFLMQGNGAEMLRLACCLLIESGIKVCAPIHDAVLIESPLQSISDDINTAQEIMSKTSSIILDGFQLRSDVDVFCYPEHFMDERGKDMWKAVSEIMDELVQ